MYIHSQVHHANYWLMTFTICIQFSTNHSTNEVTSMLLFVCFLFSTQLGYKLGSKGLHQDGPEQEQPVWHSHQGHVPHTVNTHTGWAGLLTS